MIKSRNIFVAAASVARSRIKFYFSQRFAATLERIFEVLHSVTPLLQLVSQCFVRPANKNTPQGCNTSAQATATKQIQLSRHKLHGGDKIAQWSLVSLRKLALARNVRLRFLYRQYTSFSYFHLYLNTAYGAHYVYFPIWYCCFAIKSQALERFLYVRRDESCYILQCFLQLVPQETRLKP